MANPKVELTLPIIEDMELAATKTAEVVAKRMGLDEIKTAEINMALIEACINAFEHSKSDSNVYIQPNGKPNAFTNSRQSARKPYLHQAVTKLPPIRNASRNRVSRHVVEI